MKQYFYKNFLRFFYIFTFLHLHIFTFAQDSSHLRISLLTCTPGEELYSTFGHSAFRVIDSSSVTDVVYNYGTFNFDDDGFYLKFVRGKLLYYVSTATIDEFKEEYQFYKRGITEQVLNLSPAEKIVIQQALNNNLREENKYYQYDFFLDNCTTRLRDIIKKHSDIPIVFKPVMPPGTTFRQAIHQYLNKNNKGWSKLSIDILLGAPTDAVMTTEQMQFLPDNLMKSLDSNNINRSLVSQVSDILKVNNANQEKKNSPSPFLIFTTLLVLIIALGFIQNNFVQNTLKSFYGLFFFLTGLLGCILILMWAATDHAMCKNNFNLLWAWPTHIVAAFFINTKKNWIKKYCFFTIIGLSILMLAWFFLPQQMNNSLLPLILLQIYISIKKITA
jgi:hypothetical protein